MKIRTPAGIVDFSLRPNEGTVVEGTRYYLPEELTACAWCVALNSNWRCPSVSCLYGVCIFRTVPEEYQGKITHEKFLEYVTSLKVEE